ncbi:MAG: zinc ABC transporter substrate-binding protein [Planctomycetes bacterium]|nr:zinc ABC transporter substrate-binding protein [Planctomycetota bacterium]
MPAARKAAATPTVYTTFYPTAYFAQRIGGDAIRVVCPCPADADPAFWVPDDETLARFQKADLILINGAAFEKWLATASLPASRVVDTTKPLANEFIELGDTVTHTHGPSGAHSHEGIDGHTWLDPGNAKVQAAEIKQALIKLLPAHESHFARGYGLLAQDLDQLAARFKALTTKLDGQQLVCSHPAYNYLGRRYAWTVQSYHLDPEVMPDDETIAEMKAFIAEHPARFLLWEAEPASAIAERMRTELGLQSVVVSPCELLDDNELAAGQDFLSVMNANVDRIEKALGSN